MPSATDLELSEAFIEAVAINASNMTELGKFFEYDIVVGLLNEYKISYKQQVTIDKNGIILGSHFRGNKSYHTIDFVIGDVILGSSILEYTVISCKTSCAERWSQDNWSFTLVPQLFILLTLSDSYPKSERFREGINRKIVTCNPKLSDDMKYKLSFDDLINLLKPIS